MGRTLLPQGQTPQAGDRQPPASIGKPQREMPFFSTVREPVEVSHELVESCRDELMALNRCIDLSGLADEYLCQALGIDPGHFSRIRKGRAHFPARKRLALMSLAGNILPIQYEVWKLGRKLEPLSADARIAQLQRELAALQARAA